MPACNDYRISCKIALTNITPHVTFEWAMFCTQKLSFPQDELLTWWVCGGSTLQRYSQRAKKAQQWKASRLKVGPGGTGRKDAAFATAPLFLDSPS
jgi:hypothetical protein